MSDFSAFCAMRSNANLKSRARTGSPFEYLAGAIENVHVFPSADVVHDEAAAGFTNPVVASILVRESKIWDTTRIAPRPDAFAGSSVPRSRIETSSVPPACGVVDACFLLVQPASNVRRAASARAP